jgi:hypothetical protein
VTDAGALSKLGDLLSLLPKPDTSSDESVPANPLSGLSTLLSALPLQDAEGNNPLGPFANLLGTVAEGVLNKVNGDGGEVSDPGSALANLFSAVTSIGGGGGSEEDGGNPISNFLAGLAANSPNNVNPLQSILESLPPPSEVTATDGGGALGNLMSGIISGLGGAAPAKDDISSINPLAGFLAGLMSAAGGGEESNPLSGIMSTVGNLVSGITGGGEGGVSPLIGGVLSAVGAQAAQSENPLVSFLGGLASNIPGLGQ